jgi:hypothetical protein
LFHDQNLTDAPAPAVNAVLQALIFNGNHFLKFVHGFAVRQALE